MFYGSRRQDLKLLHLYLSSENYEEDIKQYLLEFEQAFREETLMTLSAYLVVDQNDLLDIVKQIFSDFSEAIHGLPVKHRQGKTFSKIGAHILGSKTTRRCRVS